MTNLLSGAFVLLTQAFRPDTSGGGLRRVRDLCMELLEDIPGQRSARVMSSLGRMRSDDDIRHLRFALFEAVAHARGQAEAVARIANFDRGVRLKSEFNLLTN